VLGESADDRAVRIQVAGIGDIEHLDGELECRSGKNNGRGGHSITILIGAVVSGFQRAVRAGDVKNEMEPALRKCEQASPVSGKLRSAGDRKKSYEGDTTAVSLMLAPLAVKAPGSDKIISSF